MLEAELPRNNPLMRGHFKSQALLGEPALVAAMAYVDLNPIRAGLAKTPEFSDYTSIQERVGAIPTNPVMAEHEENNKLQANWQTQILDPEALQPESALRRLAQASLMPFDVTGRTPWATPFGFDDYLELVDSTGRAIDPAKRSQIPAQQPEILDRLEIDAVQFIGHTSPLLKKFGTAVGAPASLASLCARRQTKFLRGMNAARMLFLVKQACMIAGL